MPLAPRKKARFRRDATSHPTGGSPFNGATRVNADVFKNLVAWKNL